MEEWESIGSGVDTATIWACQSTALDHYEMHPTSSNIQDNIFESSLGTKIEGTHKKEEEGPSSSSKRNPRRYSDASEYLIDVNTPTSSMCFEDEEDEEDAPTFRLLLKKMETKKVMVNVVKRDWPLSAIRQVTLEEEDDVMEQGTIVRELDETLDLKEIIDHLNKSTAFGTRVASVDTRDSYGIVSEANLVRLAIEDVKVLRPIKVEHRYTLYQDWPRFIYVRHLKKGDDVDFKEENSDEMRRGFITSKYGDDRGDYIYNVRMHPREGSDRYRDNAYRFYDDYEGNEHEGSLIYRVSADRLYPPAVPSTRRVEVKMEKDRMRSPPPSSRATLIPVRISDSPPGYSFDRQSEDSNTPAVSIPSSREKIIPIRVLESPPLRGQEENRQGARPFRNLSSEFDREERDERRPPPTKPRTKFDFDHHPSRPNLPPFIPYNNSSTVRDPSIDQGRTNGTQNYQRYAQEEERAMNQNQSRMNGGMRRDDREKERRKENNATITTILDEYDGWRSGHRCQWANDGRNNEATIKWIGRLRGHNSVYAGLEFDEPVGQGTGMYQGSELFNTKPNHAGFVMIATISPLLISTSSHSFPSSFQTQNQSRDRDRQRENGHRNDAPTSAFHNISYPVVDRVGNASPPRDVPISGQGAMIPPRYKETDSIPSTSGGSTATSARHRPLPAPPPYDADRPMPLRPSPPSVPPRPAMLPEDYMIESFDVDSCVDVCYKGIVRSGVVRWKGDAINEESQRLEMSAVVELESSEAPPEGWKQSMEAGIQGVDHTLSTVIVPIHTLRRDRRFAKESSPMMGNGSSMNGYGGDGMRAQDFGSIDSGVETSRRDPWGGTDELIGRMKGVQGNRNSCYLDSMLYTLFVQCSAFDDILTRRRSEGDIKEYDELVRILSTEIVWPLRRFHYVRADHVMKLRKELEKALPNIKGLTSEEKDPEEILSSLFRDVFKTKPYLNLINSKTGKVESTWLYHVVIEAGEWQGSIASSQHLLERSLRKDLTKLAECPQVFIMQLPRYGVTKLFDKIVPLEKIDLTPFINNTVFPCAQCQKNPAELYCPECYLTKEALYGEVSYCVDCFRSVHMREGLGDHADRPIPPPSKPTKKMTRYTFTLSGVLAIETSHYVSFVRSSHGRWLFFDSMADREGLQNGFNIPQVKECERVSSWLSLAGYQRLRSCPSALPTPHEDPLVNRLLSDSYICIYTADQPSITSSNSTTSLLSNLTKGLKINRN